MRLSIELRQLKIKCGFICARNAIISVSAIFCFISASCLIDFILLLTNPYTIKTMIKMHNDLNHHVCQKGGEMIIVKEVGSDTPISFSVFTEKIYFPGSRLV